MCTHLRSEMKTSTPDVILDHSILFETFLFFIIYFLFNKNL